MRYYYIDVLRCIAIVAVISIHVNIVIGDFPGEGLEEWWFGNIMNSGARWCVPIFFMISGALLLSSSKEESLRSFLARRLTRVLGPFFFAAFLYILWKNRGQLASISWGPSLIEIIEGPVFYHLWFVYSIAGLYLAAPLLKRFVKQAEQKHLLYFLGLWLISSSYREIEKFFGVQVGFSIPVVTGYAGYFVLGYVLHTFEIHKRWLYGIYLLGIAGWIVTAAGTYEWTRKNGGVFDDFFYSYFSLNVIAMSTAVYMLVKSLHVQNEPPSILKRIVFAISRASYGIYLIHVLVIQMLGECFHLDMTVLHPWIGLPLMVVLVTGLSYVLVKMGQILLQRLRIQN